MSYGGSKVWSMFYRHGGKLRRRTLGIYPAMSLAEAREAWRETRRLVAMGQDPGRVSAKRSDTVASVVEEWLKRDKRDAKPSSIYQTRTALARDVLPVWGERPINTISKRDVIELLDGIIDRGAPGKARSVHAHLHRLFRWSVGREIVPISPMEGLQGPAPAGRRDRVLSDDELVKIWHAATEWPFGTILKLLILTGARREELTQLRWAEVVGDTINLSGVRTKTGEARTIPLSSLAMVLIEGVPRTGCEFLFSVNGRKPRQRLVAPQATVGCCHRNKPAVGRARYSQDRCNRVPEAWRQPANR